MKKFAEFLMIYCFGVFASLFASCTLVTISGVRSGDKNFDVAVIGALVLIGIISFVAAVGIYAFMGATHDLPPATSACSELDATDGARKD